MLEAAAVAAGPELALAGVTVLTSHDPGGYARAVGRSEVDLLQESERQALVARKAGLRGVVRRRSDPPGDQARVATARDASDSGATHLVVGRPILQAADPAAVLEEFMKEARCVAS